MDGGIHLGVRTKTWTHHEASLGYLSRFNAINFIDRHYDYVHTQSFESIIDDMTDYCKRKGGQL